MLMISVNQIYRKVYNPSLIADATTATPTSPSTNSGQLQNVIIKNSMSNLESTTSLDSGPPPIYHSVYNNFTTTWKGKNPMDGIPIRQSEDLLLMDVAYYGNTEPSPNHALVGVPDGTNAWNGIGGDVNSISVPFHHHLQQNQFSSTAGLLSTTNMLMSSNAVLMASCHVSASTPTETMSPYLNGNVSLVEPDNSQARSFYGQQTSNSQSTVNQLTTTNEDNNIYSEV